MKDEELEKYGEYTRERVESGITLDEQMEKEKANRRVLRDANDLKWPSKQPQQRNLIVGSDTPLTATDKMPDPSSASFRAGVPSLNRLSNLTEALDEEVKLLREEYDADSGQLLNSVAELERLAVETAQAVNQNAHAFNWMRELVSILVEQTPSLDVDWDTGIITVQ